MGDIPPSGLEWIKASIEKYKTETLIEKIIRKSKENPFVPIGIVVTCFALSRGLFHFLRGHHYEQQKMMRLRVGGQLFTVVTAFIGTIWYLPKEKRNFETLLKTKEVSSSKN